MKKILVFTAVLAVIIAAVMLAAGALRKTSKAYALAAGFKAAGLPVDEIRVRESSGMYSEVSALGEGLNVKIAYYGNGLFMDNIIKNLEAGKGKARAAEEPAILVSRLYILVVYAEPAKGMVKKALAEMFGEVREY